MSLKMSYENMECMMINVGKIYRECLEANNIDCENKEFINQIETILECMSKEYVQIIRNDFLCPKEEGWHYKIFTKKEYFTYKKGAMKKFLRCLYG